MDDGSRLSLGPHKQRALLAVLLLRRGQLVSLDRLVDELWDEHAPAAAAKSIHVYVSHLRKVLGDGVLETRGHGYVLAVDDDQVDAARFERLLEQGRRLLRAFDARGAAKVLREGLALWRGPPLADFSYEPFAQAEIARLEDLRLDAIEERIEADLALARHSELVPELERLIREHPLRERLQSQLMLALYGSGRQAEALAAYKQTRQALLDGLGIEPGPSLRETEAAILRQDPDLPVRAPRKPAPPKRGRLLAIPGAVALAAVAAAGVLLLGADEQTPTGSELRPLSSTFCSPVQHGTGARPRLLVVSDQGLRGPDAAVGNQIAAAVEHVLRERGFKAGRHHVAYQACDDSTAVESGDPETCERNARAYAANPAVVGVVGPTLSVCAQAQIPVANSARAGPLAMISASNTRVGLTRAGVGAAAGEPDRYYPTGVRNYVRLMPADDFQAAAGAIAAQRSGGRRVFLIESPVGLPLAEAFRAAAEKLSLRVVGRRRWAPDAARFQRLARAVERSGADVVYLAGAHASNGMRLVRDLRAAVGRDVTILAPDGFADPDTLEAAESATEGMLITVPGAPLSTLTGEGRELVRELEASLGTKPEQFAIYAAQAATLLLDAIARSDGTRASVAQELLRGRARGGILGDFAVTETGDTTANDVTLYRYADGRLTPRQVIAPPVSLIAGS